MKKSYELSLPNFYKFVDESDAEILREREREDEIMLYSQVKKIFIIMDRFAIAIKERFRTFECNYDNGRLYAIGAAKLGFIATATTCLSRSVCEREK